MAMGKEGCRLAFTARRMRSGVVGALECSAAWGLVAFSPRAGYLLKEACQGAQRVLGRDLLFRWGYVTRVAIIHSLLSMLLV
jgi:hypothetical protein